MLHSLFRSGLAIALLGLMLVPMASAQDRRVRHVQDNAHLFGKAAIDKANRTIRDIAEHHHKDLFIETVESGPEKKEDRAAWSRDRFNDYKLDGVYVVFSKNPKFFRIEVGNKTREKGYFTDADVKKLEKVIKDSQTKDDMLTGVANYTLEAMDRHPRQKAAAAPPVRNNNNGGGDARPVANAPVEHRDAGGSNILGWICLIVAVLVVIWVIFAVIRALTSFGGGGYGYGGGGYGYGGGGGFFTGMLGGLFGAMAGMWIYNSFFGGHATYGPNGTVNWGGDSSSAASGYGGDTDTGGSGGGGDYGGGGDDAADAGKGGDDGGDWGGKGGDDDGGGGGDWGGGGDAGGGGDWGGGGDAGGGGDWGGGGDAGGGDWGGGGGGDWGGGGGDFGGGGGGGGDW